MALVKCHECGSNVSTEAEACPSCGVKPKKSGVKAKKQSLVAVVILFLVFIIWLTIPNSKETTSDPVAQELAPTDTTQEAEVKVEPAPVAETAPPAPEHYYSMQDGNSYGYESVLSQNDINNGLVTKPLLMFSLVSKTDTKIAIKSETGEGVYSLISCEIPCEYAKITPVINGYKQKSETMAVTNDSIISLALKDAMNGFMETKEQQE